MFISRHRPDCLPAMTAPGLAQVQHMLVKYRRDSCCGSPGSVP
jgi:hypothetical protein